MKQAKPSDSGDPAETSQPPHPQKHTKTEQTVSAVEGLCGGQRDNQPLI